MEYQDTHYLNSHDLLLFSKIAFVLFEFLTDFFFFGITTMVQMVLRYRLLLKKTNSELFL